MLQSEGLLADSPQVEDVVNAVRSVRQNKLALKCEEIFVLIKYAFVGVCIDEPKDGDSAFLPLVVVLFGNKYSAPTCLAVCADIRHV